MILVFSTIIGIVLSIIVGVVGDIPIFFTLFLITPATMALSLVVWLGIYHFAEEEVIETNIYTPISIDGYEHYWKNEQVYYYDEKQILQTVNIPKDSIIINNYFKVPKVVEEIYKFSPKVSLWLFCTKNMELISYTLELPLKHKEE